MNDSDIQSMPSKRWRRRLGLGIGAILVLAATLLVAGAFAPTLPYIGIFGSLAASLWPAWLTVIALVGGLLAWKFGRGLTRLVLTGLAAVSVVGATTVIVRLTNLARSNGVQLTAGHPFGFAGSLGTVSADEVAVYTHDLGEALTVRIWKPKRQAPAGGWPVLMYVHGGGWVEMSNEQRTADMRWFSDNGWVVISINYSLSSDRRHLWDRVQDQVGCAMAWTNAHIRRRGGDPSRLALIGESAGGNLVINAAYLANAGKLRSTCGGNVPTVRAVSAIYPGVDLVAVHGNSFPLTGKGVQSSVEKYTGGTPRQFPDRYAAVDSGRTITAAAPPTLLFISENDHLVPRESMEAFDAKARQAGLPLRTVRVPFAEHGFDATGIGNALVRQVSLQFLTANDRKRSRR